MASLVLPARDRHFVRRFSGGLDPSIVAAVRAAGGGKQWFLQQLHPRDVRDPAGAAVNTWFPTLSYTPKQIFNRQASGVQGSWEVMDDLSRWTVLRRVRSSRQLQEVMTDFWSNLLHVPLSSDTAAFHRVSYDATIRKYALTSFAQLLGHTIVHPAMGLFLNNAVSTKDAPNENLGRELLELHTVGVGAGYTEQDVKASSRMLTGWRVDLWWPEFRHFYDTSWHATGRIDVMGFSHPNSDPDGRAATRAYLRYLAHHPATARRIAHRLCQRFVSDDPPGDIVRAVARAYTEHRTEIRPTLLALVNHPAFLSSAGQKVRTPMDDWVATVRALRVQVRKPSSDDSFANAMYWQYRALGAAPYEWPAPDGYPEVGSAWTAAGRVLKTLDLHRSMAGGWWPSVDVAYRAPSRWLPKLPATLGEVIDHMSVQLLCQKPTANIRRGVASAIGMDVSRTVTAGDLYDWRVQTLIASLLDSPVQAYR